MKGNEWTGWMIFKRKGNQIGLVQSSFSLSRETVEATLKARNQPGEEVRRVTVTIDD